MLLPDLEEEVGIICCRCRWFDDDGGFGGGWGGRKSEACKQGLAIEGEGLRYDLGARALASLGAYSQTCVSNCIQSVHHPHIDQNP